MKNDVKTMKGMINLEMKGREINNICIYGMGGIGGYFGGKIVHAISKFQIQKKKVFFIARGEHLAQIKKNGLILNTLDEQGMICKADLATDDITEIPTPDLCLLCVKSYGLEKAVQDLARVIKKDTIVIPLLNGVDIYERIRSVLSIGIVLPACVYVGTHIEKPGMVSQAGGDGMVLLGKDPLYPDYYPAQVVDLLSVTKLNFKWYDDVYPAIWEKYMFIAAFALITAWSEKTLGEIMQDEELRLRTSMIMSEIYALSERKKIGLAIDTIDVAMNKANKFPFEAKTSYQRDIEKGSLNEGNLFGDTIIQMGKDVNIPTPITEQIYFEIEQKSVKGGIS